MVCASRGAAVMFRVSRPTSCRLQLRSLPGYGYNGCMLRYVRDLLSWPADELHVPAGQQEPLPMDPSSPSKHLMMI